MSLHANSGTRQPPQIIPRGSARFYLASQYTLRPSTVLARSLVWISYIVNRSCLSASDPGTITLSRFPPCAFNTVGSHACGVPRGHQGVLASTVPMNELLHD
jgi:hypothetical protein